MTNSRTRSRLAVIILLFFLLLVSGQAAAPVFDSATFYSGAENTTLIFTVHASDPESQLVTYGLLNAPAGSTLNPSSGQFTWLPSYSQGGSYELTFTASDGNETISQTVTVVIANTNRPPVILPLTPYTVFEGNNLQFGVFATDPDGDSVTYSASLLPSGASFSSGMFSWTPSNSQAGSYQIQFTASDGQSSVSSTTTITVTDVSTAPQIQLTFPLSAIETSSTNLNVTTDKDAMCRYATSDISYGSMSLFEQTGTQRHSTLLTGLSGTVTYHVKCQSQFGDVGGLVAGISVTTGPRAEITLLPQSPLKPGLVALELETTSSLQGSPTLHFFFDESPGERTLVSLETISPTRYRGHLVIPEVEGVKTGTFSYSGVDLSGVVGTDIRKGKTFIADDTSPTPPKTFKAEQDPTGILLTWRNLGENLREVRIYRDFGSGVDYPDYYTAINGSSYIDTDVRAGTLYFYKIAAVDLAGNEGELSNEASAIGPDTANPSTQNTQTSIVPKVSYAALQRLNDTIRDLERSMLDLELVVTSFDAQNSDNVRYAITQLKLKETAQTLKSEVEGMRSELRSSDRFSITDDDVEKLRERAHLKMIKANQTAISSVQLVDESQSVQQLSAERLQSLFERESQALNFTASQKTAYFAEYKGWNSKLKVSTRIIGITLRSLDGKEVKKTLVTKDVTFESPTKALAAWVIERIPSEITQTQPAFNPKPTVHASGTYRFELPESDFQHIVIDYVIDGPVSVQTMQGASTYLLHNPKHFSSVENNQISSFSIFPSLPQSGVSAPIIVMILGTLAVLGLAGTYFYMTEFKGKLKMPWNKKGKKSTLVTETQAHAVSLEPEKVQPQEQTPEEAPPLIETPMQKAYGEPQPFYFADGTQARSVPELLLAIDRMDNATFARYVNYQKHDFCSWLSGSLGEHQLAALLSDARGKEHFRRELFRQYTSVLLERSRSL